MDNDQDKKRAEELAEEYSDCDACKGCGEEMAGIMCGNCNGQGYVSHLYHPFIAGFEAALKERDEKLQTLTEALEFYSDDNDWGLDWDLVNNSSAIQDRGNVARQALGKVKDEKK